MIKTSFALAGLAALALSAPAFAGGTCTGCPGAKAEKVKVTTSVNAKKVPVDAKKGTFASISTEDLKKAIADKKVTVIDVNGSESFKEGRIPTAIDFAATSDLKAKLPANKTALVVAYCGSPKCGAYKKAAQAAAALGYTNIAHYSPGISGWKAAGEAVEKG